MRHAIAFALACFALAARAELPCADTDKVCARKAAMAHPIRERAAWGAAFAKPLEERVGPASPALVEYLTLDNITNGFRERPRPAALAPDFLADVRAAIAELPPSVRRALGPDFAGLYFVDDLGGTGYTDYIHEGARHVGGYIVLDAAVLAKHRANAWATWKESSPFRPDPHWALEARIEDRANDNRRNAIQYILLHELGHVLSIGANVHPAWTQRPRDVPVTEEYHYFKLSWRIDRGKDRYASLFDADFDRRANVAYYVGARLPASDLPTAYTQLESTNFPTLYAATSPGDDFAEAFANYVHVVLLKKPFEIAIRHDGNVVKTYHACWEEQRCVAKRRVLEGLLAR